MKILNTIFTILISSILISLSGCHHDDDTEEEIIETSFNISGKVYVPGLSASTVSISDFNSQQVLATSSIESEVGETHTSFLLSDVELSDNGLYVLKVCNGIGEIGNTNGQLVKVDNLDCFYSIVTKDYLKESDVGINIFSDIFYWRTQGLTADEIGRSTINILEEFSGITDENITINSLFQLNENQTYNFNYPSFKNAYLTAVYNGGSFKDRIQKSFDILPVEILVDGGNIQTSPAELKIELKGLPPKAQYKLTVNGEELNGSEIVLEKLGINTIEAIVLIDSVRVANISTEVLTTKNTTLKKVIGSRDIETVMSINFEQSNNFVGTEITVPASQSVDGLSFEFVDVDNDIMPNVLGTSYSRVFKMLPENVLFDEPVSIKLMLDSSLTDEQIKETRIARYSELYGLEYITPSEFDYSEKAIYFETNHFSSFFGFSDFFSKGPFESKTNEMRQLEIDYLKEITGDYWYEEKLEQVLAPNDIEMSIYDYFDQLHKSKLIYEYVEEDDYVSAVKVLYPNESSVNQEQEIWKGIESKFKALEKVSSKRWPIQNFGDQYLTIRDSVYKSLGYANEDIEETVSYAPWAPVKLGSSIAAKLFNVYQNDRLKNAFNFSLITNDQTWLSELSDEDDINQNVGVVYNKYLQFSKTQERSEMEKSLIDLINARETFLYDQSNPRIEITIDSINTQNFKPFITKITLYDNDTLTIDGRFIGVGIGNFENSALTYRISRKIDKNEYVDGVVDEDGEIHFAIDGTFTSGAYDLDVTHTPTGVKSTLSGINLFIDQRPPFRLTRTTISSNASYVPGDIITLFFNDDINFESITSALSLKNHSTKETIILTGDHWFNNYLDIPSTSVGNSGFFARRGALIKNQISLRIPVLETGFYTLNIDNSIKSELGSELLELSMKTFQLVNPTNFTVFSEPPKRVSGLHTLALDLTVYFKESDSPFTIDLYADGEKLSSFEFDYFEQLANAGGTSTYGVSLCELDGYVYSNGFNTKPEPLLNADFTPTIFNNSNADFDGTISVSICTDTECDNLSYDVFIRSNYNQNFCP